MAFSYLNNMPLSDARETYLNRLTESGFASRTETVAVPEGCGRYTARAG
jgi:hypothetical protein